MKRLLLLALPLMAACEGDKVPDKPAVPAAPQVQVAPPTSQALVPEQIEPPMPADAEPQPIEIEIELDPVPVADEPEALPSERVAAPPPPAPKRPAVKAKKVEEVEIPVVELDLSLPEDWPQVVDSSEEQTSMNVLPPLFDANRNSRSVQLSGELLQNLPETDALIDGAQINFEFKR